MDNKISPQPLDTLMIKLGLSNADLVKASTDQLSFKMVQKGRSGRRLTTNGQEKILRALLAAKPELKVKRRELFRYEPSESVVAGILNALALIRKKKIKYSQFIDHLADAGIGRFAVDVPANRVTFYGSGGEAYIEQGATEDIIEHPVVGTGMYEVDVRNRLIRYKGEVQSYKETIPLSHLASQTETPKPQERTAEKSVKIKKAVRILKKAKHWKAVKLHRVKKRQFKRSY